MTTTIKVSTELRDRLKEQASRAGLTLGGYIAVLADGADRQHRIASVKAAVAATSPDETTAYADESRAWETTELTDSRP